MVLLHTKKTGANISNVWLEQHVVCNMMQSPHLNKEVAMVLSLPLLWESLDPGMEDSMPGWLRKRIREQYEVIRTLPDGKFYFIVFNFLNLF